MEPNNSPLRQLSLDLCPAPAPCAPAASSCGQAESNLPGDMEPAPLWQTEDLDESFERPERPAEPLCSSPCGWFRASARPDRPHQCMHPERRQADTEEEQSPCWPVYFAMWRRASASGEAG